MLTLHHRCKDGR